MALPALPAWATEMRRIFKGDTVSQFILTGNIRDLVGYIHGDSSEFIPLRQFIASVMFQPFDCVVMYDRGKGIRVLKGNDLFFRFLRMFDSFHRTSFASDAGVSSDPLKSLDNPGLLPRAPAQALELLDRFLNHVANAGRSSDSAELKSAAVIIDYANFIVPRGESLYLSGELGNNLIKIMSWAEDPSITTANIVTLLMSENLHDLSEFLVESPYNAKIQIQLPDRDEIASFVENLVESEQAFPSLCRVEIPVLAQKLVGLSRINIKDLILRAVRNNDAITIEYLTWIKKQIIEKEAMGKLEFIESKRTMDDVAGHEEAKVWLREDAELLRQGISHALPMGYLITGRIGTGKTYLVQCFAGECGVPFVELKNFRDKWVGSTEGNLEKIFSILHALGQVVVFVDEADQATGKRGGGDGDSGLSGRIYGMLAKEMSDTENRGKILWIFATSRPDMVEVDLKRQGRLDVHIPLFPPESAKEKRALFMAMARKLKLDLKESDIPDLPFDNPISGNELEGLLVRAIRRHQLQKSKVKKTLGAILKQVVADFRPSAHTAQLDLMDLLAVKECTDDLFLPKRFKDMDKLVIETRIQELQRLTGSAR